MTESVGAELESRRTERFDLKALHETSKLLSGSLEIEFVLNNLLLIAGSLARLCLFRDMCWVGGHSGRRIRSARCWWR
jgi:hypothetical protein